MVRGSDPPSVAEDELKRLAARPPRSQRPGPLLEIKDHQVRVEEDLQKEAWQVLLTTDPQKISRQAARRLLGFAGTRAVLPVHFYNSVLAANRHGFVKEAMELTLQLLRKDSANRRSFYADLVWKRQTLIQAMKGLIITRPGSWRKVLSLLEKAGHYTNLCDAHWDDVYLTAAFVSQELEWRKATAILEVMAQRRSHQDHQRLSFGFRIASVRLAAVARWDLAFATWRARPQAARAFRSLSRADAEASVLISTIEERMDRSSSWFLAVELISELQRRRLDFAESLRSAQKLCSKASQWASVLALQGLEPLSGSQAFQENMEVEHYYLIKAACRSRQWQEALALLTDRMLPTQLDQALQDGQLMVKAYHQVILACSRSGHFQKALEVFRLHRLQQGWSDPFLVNALMSILVAERRRLAGIDGSQALNVVKEMQAVHQNPDLLTYKALLELLEGSGCSKEVPEIFTAVEGELSRLARPGAGAELRRSLEAAQTQTVRLEVEKAWQILEDLDVEISQHWSRCFFGPLSWQLPQRQDLSSFTSRSLLNDLSLRSDRSEAATGLGRELLRKELRDARVVDEEDPVWSCHAWIQFQIFVPVPRNQTSASKPKSRGRILPLDQPPEGRWLSCRSRCIGNRKAGTTVCSQDLKDYGPPVSVRNALLQVIAMAQRRHFGEIYKGGKGDYGWIWCPELGDVFFAPRLLPHDEWNWGQKVSFALDFNRRGLPKAVKLAFEDSVPPLVPSGVAPL